jgi:hypothetical protein
MGMLVVMESHEVYRVQIRIFSAETARDLAEQVNGFLDAIPAAYVRAVRFQTAAISAPADEDPWSGYVAMVEFENEVADLDVPASAPLERAPASSRPNRAPTG